MEFLRAIGPVFNFLLLAGALFFLTRKRIRKQKSTRPNSSHIQKSRMPSSA